MVHLCGVNGCRRVTGHNGAHRRYPSDAWSSFDEKDKKKLGKAGFATPRGGAKGAYQNHVDRSNKVIIPYEFLDQVDLNKYEDGYVVRLFPDQYFAGAGQPKPNFTAADSLVKVGENAFVLYRTYEAFEQLPPPANWEVRSLVQNGVVVSRRGADVEDRGHYVLRLPTLGAERPERNEGPPQGLFATEYADEETNFLCKCVLALLIIRSANSPYGQADAEHVMTILEAEGLLDAAAWEERGVLHDGVTICPLCLGPLAYSEFHETLSLDSEGGLENAALQVEGATRSTKVNLFHLRPLFYKSLVHVPTNVGWGHAVCNTRLGQRPCYSIPELEEKGRHVTIVGNDGNSHDALMSSDGTMIRSERGGVWIEIVREGATGAAASTENIVDKTEAA